MNLSKCQLVVMIYSALIKIDTSYSLEICTDPLLYTSDGKRFDGAVLATISPIGYQQCLSKCRRLRDCGSTNYNMVQLTCELMSGSTDIASLSSDVDFIYSEFNVTQVTYFQGSSNVCQRNTCQEGHICIELASGSHGCVEDITNTQTTTTTPQTTTITPQTTTTTPQTTTTTPQTTTTTTQTTTTTPQTTTTTTPTTTTTTTQTTTTTASSSCGSSGFIYEASVDICYRLIETLSNKNDAQSTCEGFDNGRPIMLNTAGKKNFMINVITNLGYTDWWIDGYRSSSSAPYQWVNGDNVDPQPTDASYMDRRMVLTTSGFEPKYLYSDLPCICEIAES